MKYEDLDPYIESLFHQPASSQDADLSGFDDRLANVEQAILDAYESAMRWHSAQIAGEDDSTGAEPASPSWDTSAALGYEYWSEEVNPPLSRFSAARPATGFANRAAADAMDAESLLEPEAGDLTCGEILVILAAILFVFFFMVIAS
jgi:hypothetical protein